MSAISVRVAALTVALLLLLPASAKAGGGTTVTRCGTYRTLCLATTSTVTSVCGKLPWDKGGGVNCTGVSVAAATPAQPLGNYFGGSVSWSGRSECQLRERGDGFNNDWTPWRGCNPVAEKAKSDSRSWGMGGTPAGGTITFTWDPEINSDTWLVDDCIEVRVWVWTIASARNNALGVTIDTVNGDVLYPSYGNWRYTALCESDSSQREWIAGW